MNTACDPACADIRTVCAGNVPESLASQFQSVPEAALRVECMRIPKVGTRDPIYNASPSWLREQNEKLPPQDRFIFKVRKLGAMRSACFINIEKYRAFMTRLMKAAESSENGTVEV